MDIVGRVWPVVRSICLLLLLACGLIGSRDVRADAPERWRFDTAQSEMNFQLSAIGIVTIRGWFEAFSGEIWRDPADGMWRVNMRIDAGSLAMASDRYRDWARSREFFDVRRHPEIVFRSGPVSDSLLTDGGDLAGTLRLRGIEREVGFHVQASRCAKLSDQCELHVFGEINRRQFGMNSRRLTLSDRVVLDMRFVTAPQPKADIPESPSLADDQPGSE